MDEVESERRPLVTAVPEYPAKELRERVEATVSVCFTIDYKGRVRKPYVFGRARRAFARAALRAVRASSYEPLHPSEPRRDIEMCRTFRFRLEPQEPD